MHRIVIGWSEDFVGCVFSAGDVASGEPFPDLFLYASSQLGSAKWLAIQALRYRDARPVIAYPPFVFVDAAQKMTSGIRDQASYRPAGGMACSANGETIKFILP